MLGQATSRSSLEFTKEDPRPHSFLRWDASVSFTCSCTYFFFAKGRLKLQRPDGRAIRQRRSVSSFRRSGASPHRPVLGLFQIDAAAFLKLKPVFTFGLPVFRAGFRPKFRVSNASEARCPRRPEDSPVFRPD
jgi:hypothetical protein